MRKFSTAKGVALALSMSLVASAPSFATGSPAGDLGKESLAASQVRGGIVFRTYCVLCHGSTGQGNGRAAARYLPPPANLTISGLSDKQKETIIRGGGASVGRSPFMPPWGKELTDEQIGDLLSYLRLIKRS